MTLLQLEFTIIQKKISFKTSSNQTKRILRMCCKGKNVEIVIFWAPKLREMSMRVPG